MKKRLLQGLWILLFLAIYAAASLAIVYILHLGGLYPQGSDTMYHVYRGDTLYRSIQNGDWFPLYDHYWYNGVENMRFWAPLSPYVYAALEAVLGGSFMGVYYWYCGLVLFFGGIAWLYIGFRKGRPVLGGFLGLLWFFLPNNLYAMFGEGNLPRSLSMIFLPLLFYHVADFMESRNYRHLKWIVLWMTMMLLCHLGYGGMVAMAVLVYLLLDKLINHRKRAAMAVIFAMVIPFLLLGVWLFPSLKGGITSTDSSQVMKSFFQPLWTSINPLYRLSSQEQFYFGLAVFLLVILGVICSKRKSMPGFLNGLIILFCTTTLAYPLLSRLPGSQYLWMLRFISIALCMILYSLLLWDSLKQWILLLVCALLVLDTIPSIPIFYRGVGEKTPEENLEDFSQAIMLDTAKDITVQRMALLDGSSNGALPHFIAPDFGEKKVAETFGAGFQSAATAHNIVMLNEAIETGAYPYLFDRLLELGNDTILISIGELQKKGEDLPYLDECAALSGYELVDKNGDYLLYHFEPGHTGFGTVSRYKGIGIGTNSSEIQLSYPVMEEGESDNLTDYSIEDLKDYEVIYLDHFEYDDRETAEQLVKDLSDAGVRIVINADGIPVNGISKVREFLGVNCSRILFENGYPFLFINDQRYDLDFFEEGYENWETVFLNNLDRVDGYFYDNGLEEEFLGTVYNDNITIIGLNMIFHYMLTGDPNAGDIIQSIIKLDPAELPERELTPVDITYGTDHITVETVRDKVNTSLAFHDIFHADRPIMSKNHLLLVDKGKTEIDLSYPYLKQGAALSLIGVLVLVLFLAVSKIRYTSELEKESNE